MRRAAAIVCCALALVGSRTAQAQPRPDSASIATPAATTSPRRGPESYALDPGVGPGHWFYQRLPYGSDALISPAQLIFNGGFGTLQFDNRSNRLGDVPFHHGWRRLWLDLRAPGRTIKIDGWNDFIGTEVLPVTINRETAQYWPNYTLHLIGGGMSSVMMREWYEQHGYRRATLASSLTLSTYHVLNEVVEAGDRYAPSTDAIADLMLFDPAGAWLFSHEGVDGFFSRRLHLRDWSGQPAIDPATSAVVNNGQNFSIKVAIPRTEHWSLFYYFGNHGEAGLSYRFRNGSAISGGTGLSAQDLEDLGHGVQTANLVPSGGVFYDRNGSLLLSLTTVKSTRYGLRLNAYPGLVRVHGWTAGLFLLHARSGGATVGFALTPLPVGVAGRL